MLKVFYTTQTNLDEHNMVIDNTLVLSKEAETNTVEEGYIVTSTWDLDDWIKIDVRNQEEVVKQLKAAKDIAKANLVVTTTLGNAFDGNESARINMLSALEASSFLNVNETNWKLADNTVKLIETTELKEALAKSTLKCGQIVMASTIEELNSIQ